MRKATALAFLSSFITWLKAIREAFVDTDVDELPADAAAIAQTGYHLIRRPMRRFAEFFGRPAGCRA